MCFCVCGKWAVEAISRDYWQLFFHPLRRPDLPGPPIRGNEIQSLNAMGLVINMTTFSGCGWQRWNMFVRGTSLSLIGWSIMHTNGVWNTLFFVAVDVDVGLQLFAMP